MSPGPVIFWVSEQQRAQLFRIALLGDVDRDRADEDREAATLHPARHEIDAETSRVEDDWLEILHVDALHEVRQPLQAVYEVELIAEDEERRLRRPRHRSNVPHGAC